MNQIARIGHNSGISSVWTARQVDTIWRTVAKDTNQDEFDLFVEYCTAKRLDPFVKQVIAIVFSKDDPKKRQMTIITTQDGLRVMAARCGDYRPEETEPEYEYDPDLKGPTNPHGIIKCSVKLWKQDAHTHAWHPVNGTAYWDEFAPIKTDDRAYEWVDTGDTWDNGKPKKRRQLREGVDASKLQTLDDSGQWKKMARNQIAKCARMQALRGGWPETFSGVYAQEELDRAIIADMTASEMVEAEREQRRMLAISAYDGEIPIVDANGDMRFIAAGRYADELLQMTRLAPDLAEFDAIKSRNREGFKRFWAKHKNDALEVNKQLEATRSQLAKASA